MKRLLTTAIVAAALLIPTTNAGASGWTGRMRECRFQTSDGHMGWSEKDIHRTIRCAVEHWPVPGGFTYAHYISERESSDTAYAINSYSGACGTFQSLPSLWPGRIAWFHRVTGWPVMPQCTNARSNILWAIKWVHTYGSWQPWAY